MAKQCGWVLVFALVFAGFLGSDLKAAEAKGKGKSTAETRFRVLDKNGDKALTPDEYIGLKEGEAQAKAMNRFRKLDKNRDGRVTWNEYKAASAKKTPKSGKPAARG